MILDLFKLSCHRIQQQIAINPREFISFFYFTAFSAGITTILQRRER